jgi:hypothetical protein
MHEFSLDNRHKLARPYWARPGFALFAKKADDDEGGVDPLGDDEDDDDEDDDDEDDPDEGKSEDELRAELKKVRASLGKANGSSAKRRKRARELQDELDRLKAAGKPKGKKADDDEDEDELDVDAIREAARREGEKAGNDRVKKAELRTALAKAGVRDDAALKRLVGMVKLDDFDIDDDGEVDGLDDLIDELKADLPALFGTRRKRESVAGDNDRDGGGGRERKTATASEQAAAKLLGRGSR